MNPKVICVSGGIGSGKTQVSRQLAERLGWKRASCGDYVRTVAQSRGLGVDRDQLQALGESMIATDIPGFCTGLLAYATWSVGQPLVVDGIRHVAVLERLRQEVAPVPLVLCHLGTADEVRTTRLASVRRSDADRLATLDEHSTEVEVKAGLRDAADLVLDGSFTVETIVAAAMVGLGGFDHISG
ncbi:MAG: AAA family ATPase [Myxococcales bacterium]|nr:AAA family ATPase [Myxococcales bacterium]